MRTKKTVGILCFSHFYWSLDLHCKMAEFPLLVPQIWQSRKWVTNQILLCVCAQPMRDDVRVSKSFVFYPLSTEAEVYCPLTSFINLLKSKEAEINFLMLWMTSQCNIISHGVSTYTKWYLNIHVSECIIVYIWSPSLAIHVIRKKIWWLHPTG